ncbi:MAG: VOC family protein [Sphingomonadales bacterium]|nr:VOC family protein [Sphingomonadales bacterium]
MSSIHGAFIWYELMTTDAAGAKAFYEAVVDGWSIQPGSQPPMFYGHILNADGGSTGGVLPLTAEMQAGGARPGWVGYIAVDDVDAATAAIERAGGTVLMPRTTIDVGSFALVADCCGTPFYVMTPVMPAGASEGSTAYSPTLTGRCGWNELWTANPDSALAFYTGQFGWTLPEPMDMGAMGKYQFIARDGQQIGAICRKPEQMPVSMWNHYFRVPGIAAAKAAAEANGGRVVMGPHQVPTGDWIIQGIDPQGAFFALVGGQ